MKAMAMIVVTAVEMVVQMAEAMTEARADSSDGGEGNAVGDGGEGNADGGGDGGSDCGGDGGGNTTLHLHGGSIMDNASFNQGMRWAL